MGRRGLVIPAWHRRQAGIFLLKPGLNLPLWKRV